MSRADVCICFKTLFIDSIHVVFHFSTKHKIKLVYKRLKLTRSGNASPEGGAQVRGKVKTEEEDDSHFYSSGKV